MQTLATPTDSLEGIDVVLFLVDAAEELDRDRTLLVAGRARMRGILVAGVLVDDGACKRSAALAILREATDMLMIVRDRASIDSIVRALR